MKHRLTNIKYFQGLGLEFLTFCFPNEVISPPSGTYRKHPNRDVEVPEELRTLKFGIRQGAGIHWVSTIKMEDGTGRKLGEVMEGHDLPTREVTMGWGEGETIVAVKVRAH